MVVKILEDTFMVCLLFSDELLKEVDSGKIILGGCCIMDDAPKYHCNACNEDFGHIRENVKSLDSMR